MASMPRTQNDTLFEQLPVEIIEFILCDLPLDGIRNLRLTSRTISQNASTGRFKTFCRNKDVNLRVPALRVLSDMLVPGSVACNLQHLTITGVLYKTESLEKVFRTNTVPADPTDIFGQRRDALGNDTAKRPIRVKASSAQLIMTQRDLDVLRLWQQQAASERSSLQDLAALTEVFKRIREHGVSRGLQSIKLFVAVARSPRSRLAPVDGGNWRGVWETAQQTFSVTLQALSLSGVALQQLDAFGHITKSSVSSYDIATAIETCPSDTVEAALKNLRSFAISTSPRVIPHTGSRGHVRDLDPDDEVRDQGSGMVRRPDLWNAYPTQDELYRYTTRVHDPKDITGLATLLSKMPYLETLDMHRYQLAATYPPEPHHPNDSLTLRNIVRQSNLRGLKTLTLRGWAVECVDLLALLRMNTGLCDVDLHFIQLEGSWQPLFAHMTSPQHAFTRLRFDTLYENDSFVILPHPHDERIQAVGVPAPSGWATHLLDGREAVLKGLTYSLSAQSVMGCVQHSMWRQERSTLYGPPSNAPW